MKKIILVMLFSGVIGGSKAQVPETKRLTFATGIATGVAMSEPAVTPFTWQVIGHYAVSKRCFVGIGSGLSFYEKTLIPLFADVKWLMTKPKRWTPFLECGVGYSFAPEQKVNGGFYLNPSVGMQYSLCRRQKLFLALGYDLQEFERLKTKTQSLFVAEFAEHLSHHSVSIKVGWIF